MICPEKKNSYNIENAHTRQRAEVSEIENSRALPFLVRWQQNIEKKTLLSGFFFFPSFVFFFFKLALKKKKNIFFSKESKRLSRFQKSFLYCFRFLKFSKV